MVNSVLWVESMPSLRNIRPSSNTRSTPPTSSRFRYSSLATRRYRSVSRALWWVTNGRARAPPGTGLRIGVSTSRKPRASIDSRRDRTTRERTRMARMAGGLAGGAPLAGADLDVGQALPLGGQGPQGLAEQVDLGRPDRQLALPGLDDRPL